MVIKLDRNEETVYRQYYRTLKDLVNLAESEMNRYEKGDLMSGAITSVCGEAMKHGAMVEMISDWLIEEND